jgi:hypothetical protein
MLLVKQNHVPCSEGILGSTNAGSGANTFTIALMDRLHPW